MYVHFQKNYMVNIVFFPFNLLVFYRMLIVFFDKIIDLVTIVVLIIKNKVIYNQKKQGFI